jgi:hypothetical protein
MKLGVVLKSLQGKHLAIVHYRFRGKFLVEFICGKNAGELNASAKG